MNTGNFPGDKKLNNNDNPPAFPGDSNDNHGGRGKVSGSSENIGKVPKTAPTLTNLNIMPEEMLIEKSKRWRQLNIKRFAEKRKFGFVEGQKDKLPCEVLR